MLSTHCYYGNRYINYCLVSGDSIEPDKEKNVITKETETVKLSCSYSTTSNEVRLFWYRQYLHGELLFLTYRGARSWKNTDTADARFQSVTSDTSTELTITDVHLSDSAHYYCALLVAAQTLYKNLTHIMTVIHKDSVNAYPDIHNLLLSNHVQKSDFIFLATK
uniref:Ig-like domain-containing protein n=1 Tax=Cyprinus carpio TaxID=7962 RepID=A0A8C1LSN5_CYPCA